MLNFYFYEFYYRFHEMGQVIQLLEVYSKIFLLK